MTRVTIKNGKAYEIELSGHAEKRNEGDGNRLCAAISMISQTFLECVYGKTEVDYKKRPGYLKIVCDNVGITPYIDMLETGLLLLEQEYPENINVVGESVRKVF